MDFIIEAYDWKKAADSTLLHINTDCIIVGVFHTQTLSGIAQKLDVATKGLISRLVKSGDLNAKAGSTLMLYEVVGISAPRVLLVSLGRQVALSPKTFIDVSRAAWRAVLDTRAASATWMLTQVDINNRDSSWGVRMSALTLRELTYRYTQTKSKVEIDANNDSIIKKVVIVVDPEYKQAVRHGLDEGIAIANGIDLTRELGNLPGNICTPAYLASIAKHLGINWSLKVDVLEQKQIEILKMGSFLSVAKGSAQPPKFIVLEHQGTDAKQAPVVLVGKGITFDSGGISIKPGESMDEMKYDMCGAGSVLGTFRAIAEINLQLNVVGLIPACENMPSGNANKPGDIVTSMSGQTIEVLNTDAEGRLVLCDALTYAERFKPAAVIDIATLTGACVIALGHHNSGLFSKNDALADMLLAAGLYASDTAWRLPLDEEYQEQLKSNFADMANIGGGRSAGSVMAACFLERFSRSYPWAHLDIAGTAWKGGREKSATGRPVSLLTQFLIDRAK
ncbi:leucyl aminopeptidase [Candidatus Vallotia tarda]|uniref:Probable cytosol aminopeptidase n=1 Tax=Candidatus Vallotiella hemipterorum TaxID=1177213 RepID=A0A916JSV2_9BURK|nr:leucyl aminopeptidase [Candidatus Vallotia tarda]CAG7600517.1 Probable cytosol aminopeptidase [Candidatus Vallotia tarda]